MNKRGLYGLFGLIGLFAVHSIPAVFAAAPIKLPTPQQETLPNGLKIAWFLSDTLPVIDLSILIQAGDRDDPDGKSGTTQLLAACLDRGAAGMSAQDIAHAVEMLGASRYAAADGESFSAGMHGLAPDAFTLLDLLGKIVVHPDFPAADMLREQARILDAREHIGDYGETLADIAFSRIMTAGTPYGRGGTLSSQQFKTITRDDVLTYYKKNFTPKNAILMVVGRVDQAAMRAKILEAFGGWQGDAPKHEIRDYTDPRLASVRIPRAARSRVEDTPIVIVDRSELTQAQVKIGFKAPLVKAPEHYALTVANSLLGEYFNSRLNSLIRDKLGLTYSISSSFTYDTGLAYFSISSATRNETVGQLIRKTLDVLKDMKQGEIPAEEVQMAKDYLLGSFPLIMSTLGSTAARWLAGYIFDLGPDYLNEYIPKIQAVTAAEVASSVAKDFDLGHLAIVVAGDAKEIEKSLAGSKLKVAKKLAVKDLL